jgi:hypothetical protein
MPSVVCYKHVTARIERSEAETFTHGGPYPSLRDAMLALTSDGDFQACGFVPGETWLEVIEAETVARIRHTSKTFKVSRVHEIQFKTWATDDMRAKDASRHGSVLAARFAFVHARSVRRVKLA